MFELAVLYPNSMFLLHLFFYQVQLFFDIF